MLVVKSTSVWEGSWCAGRRKTCLTWVDSSTQAPPYVRPKSGRLCVRRPCFFSSQTLKYFFFFRFCVLLFSSARRSSYDTHDTVSYQTLPRDSLHGVCFFSVCWFFLARWVTVKSRCSFYLHIIQTFVFAGLGTQKKTCQNSESFAQKLHHHAAAPSWSRLPTDFP